MRLEFLGHDGPALPKAAEFLLAAGGRKKQCDLRGWIVVVPGARAGRRLLEILVDLAEKRHLVLVPPTIETVGKLPERLYRPKRPFANDLVQRLVWVETLRGAKAEQLQGVVPRLPAAGEASRWLALADLLRKQHTELAADGLEFGDVARLGADVEGFDEHDRWRSMHGLQQEYLRRLDSLELWDIQTARLKAVEFGECHTDQQILLVGAVDLNRTLRRMLDQVADRVTALVFAPEEWRARFDEHGCLVASAWADVALPIEAQQLAVVDGPADQAQEVVRFLADCGGRYAADEIVVGVPDELLVPDLERRLAAAGVLGRWGPGVPLEKTAPYRLVAAITAYLEHGRYAEISALVRHPDFAAWLVAEGTAPSYLEQLDQYQNEHLPFRVDEWLSPDCPAVVRDVCARVVELLAPLGPPARPLVEWNDGIWQVLRKIYGRATLDTHRADDRAVREVCESVQSILAEHQRVPAAMMPVVAGSQALRWVLDELRRGAIPAPPEESAVELLGWLELPLDDAPVLVVTSFNDGFVPESLNSDLFLPNNLRQRIGLLDNAQRYARDAYAVALLVHSRESLRWIVGKRNHQGDPLIPSRLLFACDAETTVERALHLFRPTEMPVTQRSAALVGPAPGLSVPRPVPLSQAITHLNVTAFRDYLACPYRFYLRHVLGLREQRDDRDELDGGGFGSLAHEVLRLFGLGTVRHATDAESIRAFLESELDQCVARKFGGSSLPAVLVQVEQLRWRLRAFAEKQAAWAREGWRIEFIEAPAAGTGTATLNVDGEPLQLRGRIDRIDRNLVTGEWVVLDYKTSDEGRSPDRTHRRGAEWVDLQLPLYRHLAAVLGIRAAVRLGYIILPKDTGSTSFSLADWSTGELEAADEMARNVVRRIRRQEFWPPTDPAPAFSEEFAYLCQDAVIDRQ